MMKRDGVHRWLAAPAGAFVLGVALTACGPQAGEPVPGEPGSPVGPEQAGGPPPPLTPDTDPIERQP